MASLPGKTPGASRLVSIAGGTALAVLASVLLLIVVSQKLGANALLGFAFLGIVVIQVSLAPTKLEVALAAAIGALYGGIYVLLGGPFAGDALSHAVGLLAFAGAGSAVVMAMKLVNCEHRTRSAQALVAGLTPVVFVACMPLIFPSTGISGLDAFAFDARLGLPAGLVPRTFAGCPALHGLCVFVSLSLPLVLAGIYAISPDVPDEPGLMRTFLLTGILAATLAHVLRDAGLKTDSIPSMHAAWALLVFWRTRGRGIVLRAGAALVLVLTLLAALGVQEQRLVDLAITVPFVVAVRAVCAGKAALRSRLVVFALTGGVVALWMCLLRAGVLSHVHPLTAWGLALLTVAGALWLDIGMGRYRFRIVRKRLFPDPVFARHFSQPAWPARRRRQWAGVL